MGGGGILAQWTQGRSQRGVQGVQVNPPSKLMIFMTIVLCLMEKLMAEIF